MGKKSKAKLLSTADYSQIELRICASDPIMHDVIVGNKFIDFKTMYGVSHNG